MSDDKYPYKAKRHIQALIKSLRAASERDPDQEVQGMALPVLDAVIEEVKAALGEDPVVRAVAGVISPETIELGEGIRAVDALLVAEQLDAALGNEPSYIATAEDIQLFEWPPPRRF